MERLTILGSTGSIGTQTLDIVRRNPERFRITSLVAHSRWQELAEQAREFAVESVVIGDKSHYKSLKEVLQGTNIEVMAGSEAIEE
ncbi:MAG: 1-deoxy-D-xylulose-5-phosphate reductoisomerase, partial [Alistipes sp.]|nr:1-deoxy-D-xylulose-5-phosphate reductoisomerase [Alistipes sp.]